MSSNYNNNIFVFILSAQCLGTFLLLKSAQNVPYFDYFYEEKKQHVVHLFVILTVQIPTQMTHMKPRSCLCSCSTSLGFKVFFSEVFQFIQNRNLTFVLA